MLSTKARDFFYCFALEVRNTAFELFINTYLKAFDDLTILFFQKVKPIEPTPFENRQCHIIKLPEDTLATIFTFLTLEDLSKASRISKQWNAIVFNNPMIWKECKKTTWVQQFHKIGSTWNQSVVHLRKIFTAKKEIERLERNKRILSRVIDVSLCALALGLAIKFSPKIIKVIKDHHAYLQAEHEAQIQAIQQLNPLKTLDEIKRMLLDSENNNFVSGNY